MSLFTTARSAVGVVTRHNDINIVFLLVTVIALMIIPLPTPVEDTLIGVSFHIDLNIKELTHSGICQKKDSLHKDDRLRIDLQDLSGTVMLCIVINRTLDGFSLF